jgi:PAS domain S-box-containing protein
MYLYLYEDKDRMSDDVRCFVEDGIKNGEYVVCIAPQGFKEICLKNAVVKHPKNEKEWRGTLSSLESDKLRLVLVDPPFSVHKNLPSGSVMCVYPELSSDKSLLLSILHLYPYVLFDGYVCENPYYGDTLLAGGQGDTKKATKYYEFLKKRILKWEESRRELLKERELLNKLMETTPSYVVILDEGGKILRMSQSLSDMLGASAGMRFFDFVVERDKKTVKEVFEKLVSEKISCTCECALRSKNGEERLISWQSVAIPLWDRMEIVALGQDITERTKMEKELEQAYNSLRRHVEELSILNSIAKNISGSLDFKQVAEEVLEGAIRLTEASHGILVMRYGEIEREFVFPTNVDEEKQKKLREIVNEVLLKQKTSSSNEVIHSLLKFGKETAGAVVLVGEFDKDDVRIVNQLVEHASAALRASLDAELLKKAESGQRRANELLRTIRLIDQLIVVERDRDSLLQRVCELLNSLRGYRLVWVALKDPSGTVVPVAYSGDGKEELSGVNLCWKDAESTDPVCKAIRENKLVVSPEYPHLPISSISIPIAFEGRVYGALNVYVDDISIILDDEERGLLEGLTDDLGIALHLIEEEKMRRESEELFMMLSENEALGVYMERGGVFKYVSDAMASMVGYFKEELFGKSLENLVHPDDKPSLHEFRKSYEKGQGFPIRLVRKDGSIVYCELYEYSTNYGEESVRVGTIVDVTERTLAEKERKKLIDRLSHSDRLASVGMLAGGVAHEINNPLTIILNYTWLLKDDIDEEEKMEMLTEIEQAALRIKRIVAELLEFSRKGEKELKEVDLNIILEKTLSVLSHEFKVSSIKVEKDLHPIPKVLCQPEHMMQVFFNILTNSIYALNEKYPETHENKKIIVRTKKEGIYVSIEIRDNGIGMSKDIIEHIFDPFFTTKQSEEATGLGLSIAHNIVKAHGGEILVESKEGEYSSFTVKLPLEGRASTAITSGRRVLIVDDEPKLRKALRIVLEREGFEVLEAQNADEGIYKLSTEPIDVVLLDIIMPGKNGMHVLRHIEISELAVPVIILTGQPTIETASEAVRRGAFDYLTKPIENKKLIDVMKRAVAERAKKIEELERLSDYPFLKIREEK